MPPAAEAEPSELTALSMDVDQAGTDLENESRSAFNVRQQSAPPTVKKQLFQTPVAQPGKLKALSANMSPATPRYNNSITKRYYRRQTYSTTTPHPTRPAPRPAMSTARKRPSVARLHTTPGMRRRYVTITPDMWRNMQIEDLTAWLNSELVDSSLSSSYLPIDSISDSPVFLKQVSDMHHLYKSTEIQDVLAKVDKEIREVRFFVSKKIQLSTHHESREKLISLLLLNYHPSWLLVALCAILGSNFGANLDHALKEAKRSTQRVDADRIFMSVLEDAIQSHLLANNRPGIDAEKILLADKRRSFNSLERESYNGLVLQRVLHLIFLLDQAKQSREPIILTDPPLFRYGSDMTSSKDLVEQIGKDFLREQGNVVRFLAHRLYRVTYVTPIFERGSLAVVNLSDDLRDGTRLCKLASIMVRDRKLLNNIRRVNNGMSNKATFSCHLGNVSRALNKMQEYATTHVQSSFEWRGTHQDIVMQKMEKTVTLLWQIVGLWVESVVLDKNLLESELKIVQQEYRESTRQSTTDVWSPNGGKVVAEVQPRVISPSRLTVYEKCESESGHLLLRWCATVSGMYGVTVRDFCESFRDGAALCLILHHYCPTLIRADEITRVQAAELRSVTDSEAEAALVQKNFDLFTDRSRSLGTIPNIPIRAEAALAPSFISSEKDDSFGRVMELLSSYLFRRLVMEKAGGNDREYVQQFVIEEQLSRQQDEALSRERTRLVFAGKLKGTPVLEADGASLGNASTGVETDGDCLADGHEPYRQASAAQNAPSEAEESSTTVKDGQGYPSTMDEAVDVSEERSDMSLRSLSAEREAAAKVIIRHYRAAKSRQQYLSKRDAVINIQAGVRGFLVRERVAGLSDEYRSLAQAEDSLLETKLYLKPWPSVASSDLGLKAISKDMASTKKGFNSQESVQVIEQVSMVLPILRQHMENTTAFAERMMEHEQAQAAVTLHNSSQADQPAEVAVVRNVEPENSQSSTSTLRNIASGVFGVARSIALSFASEADSQRRSYVTTLVGALQSAENAYEKEMMRATAHTEAERAERIQRQDHMARIRQAQAEEESRHQVDLQNHLASADRAVSGLNAKIDEAENLLDNPCRKGDVNIDSIVSSSNWSSRLELPSEPDRNPSWDAFTDITDGAELRSLEDKMQSIRTQEIATEQELDKLHSEWDKDLADTEDQLRHWKVLLLKGGHYKAMQEFTSFMASAVKIRSKHLAQREHLSSAITGLDSEQKQASREELMVVQNLETDLSALGAMYSEMLTAVSLRARKTEDIICSVDSAAELLQRYELKCQMAEIRWQSAVREFEADALRCRNASEEYQAWLSESEHADRLLDQTIRGQEEMEEQIATGHRLRNVLRVAEEKYVSAMRESHNVAQEDSKLRAERESELVSMTKRDESARQQLEHELVLLRKSRSHTDQVMADGLTLVESLNTPVRRERFPALEFSPGHPSPRVTCLSPVSGQFRELKHDIDETLTFIDEQRVIDKISTEDEAIDVDSVHIPSGSSAQADLQPPILLDGEDIAHSPGAKNVSDVDVGVDDCRSKQPDEDRSHPSTETGVEDENEPQNGQGPSCDPNKKSTSPGPEAALSSPDLDNLAIGDVLSSENPSSAPRAGRSSQGQLLETGMLSASPSEAASVLGRSSFGAGSRTDILSSLENQMGMDTSPKIDDALFGKSAAQEESNTGFFNSTPFRFEHNSPFQKRLSVERRQASPLCSPNQLQSGTGFTPAISNRNDSLYSDPSGVFSTLEMPPYFGITPRSNYPVLARDQVTGETSSTSVLPRFSLPLLTPGSAAENGSAALSPHTFSVDGARRGSMELGQLSLQLDELNIGNVPLDNVGDLMQKPSSAEKLGSILRRISAATSSQSVKGTDSSRAETSHGLEESPASNIIKTVFIVIRQCTRSARQRSLVELGMTIIRDMAENEFLVDSIFQVEDCVEMLVTGIQFYRDCEEILSVASQALFLLSGYRYGQMLICADESIMHRVRGVHSILQLQSERKQKCEDRLRRADIIIDAVRKCRENGTNAVPFSQEIKMASLHKATSPPISGVQLSHRFLSELVNRFNMI